MLGPIMAQLMAANRIIAEEVVTSGTLHIATKDGEAMFFHDLLDFTSLDGVDYSGTDAGSTPYRFVFTDAAGKQASAYGGAAGGGEALGADVLSGWELTSGWLPGANAEIIDTDTYRTTAAYSNVYKNAGAFPDVGAICKFSFSLTPSTGSYRVLNLATSLIYCIGDIVGGYKTVSGDTGIKLQNIAAGTITTDIGTMITQQLIDIPATGLHLMSAKNGTTRNMASVESGFNQNTVVLVEIYNA